MDPVATDIQSTKAASVQRRTLRNSDGPPPPFYTNETILSGTTLKDILLRDFSTPQQAVQFRTDPVHPQRRGMFGNDQLIMSWCARQLRETGPPLEVEGDPKVDQLNRSQRKAIAMMLSERISLIQGVSFPLARRRFALH
jgi:hypothetical protein